MNSQKVLFIANVEYLEIAADLGRGEKVGDALRITNNTGTIAGLLTPVFREVAGSLEESYLREATAVAYALEEVPPFKNDDEALRYLSLSLRAVHLFLHVLWLVKDNSANADLAYVEHPYRGAPMSRVSRNNFAHFNSTAAGALRSTAFSREEFRRARELFRSVEVNAGTTQSATQDHGRVDKAFYFIQAARGSDDLGVKIANYCSAFDALFSRDAQELTHKLAERVACFLEERGNSRIEVFQAVKRAYGIRSRVVHGAMGQPKLERLVRESAAFCDDITRRILNRILDQDDLRRRFILGQGRETLDEYFVRLVLA